MGNGDISKPPGGAGASRAGPRTSGTPITGGELGRFKTTGELDSSLCGIGRSPAG
jgi:hypothetical protein